MSNYSRIVDEVIRRSDILLIVLDARRIASSINHDLEKKVMNAGKKYVYVINKCDLVDLNERNKGGLPNSVRVSAKLHLSTMKLLQRLRMLGKGKEVVVGVIGYPNTGKSTLINALKGQHSTLTSPISGFTKGIQKVRISRKILMLDTPGVIPYSDKQNVKEKEVDHVLIGVKDADKVREPDLVAMEMIDKLEGKIEEFYGVEKHEDAEETLSEIAIKKHILMKGKEPDLKRMGREIIALWQKGKII